MKPKSTSIGSSSAGFTPLVLEASSVGLVAYSRLRSAKEGTIDGVFDGAINVLLTSGLISLVPEAVERGPLNVTLQLPTSSPKMSFFGVRAGEKVMVQGSTLDLGRECRIAFSPSRIYRPKRKFRSPLLEKKEIAANLQVMRSTALSFGSMEGLGDLVGLMRPKAGKVTRGNLNIFARATLPRILRLERAIGSGERSAMSDAVGELIGLGPGLTPSSDDMLAGLVLVSLLYAENSGRAQSRSRLIAEMVDAQARGKTTLLSEEHLRLAASARGNEPVLRLCTALLTGERDSVERETRRVLAIGKTSGTDTVLGIILGTKACMGRQSGLRRMGFQ